MAVDTLGELAEIATRAIPGAGLAVERIGERAHDTATPQFISSPGYEHAWLNPDNTEVSIEDLLSAPAIKLLIRKAGARSADMAAELTKHVGIEGDITYSTNNGLVEIVPLGISKATGVEEVARPLGIASHEVAFGDMPNDVPMLLWAGRGVAMGNAHPDVRAAADEVTVQQRRQGWGCWNAGGRALGGRRMLVARVFRGTLGPRGYCVASFVVIPSTTSVTFPLSRS
jgi:hydroxymethylpyrimidine pyrophosphatase-like HAD family hydrolase